MLVARRRDRLEELATELAATGVRAEPLVADLASDEGLALVERRVASARDLAVLVNNAGFADIGPFAEQHADRAEASVRVLVLAPVRLTRAALPVFRERGGGAVIQVSSRAAFGARRDLATYGAAKAYLHRFSLALADELEGTGIDVLSVCPGNVWTEFFERAGLEPDAIRSALEPEQVVAEALTALDRGERVCVPGERARDRVLRRLLPDRLLAKLAAVSGRLAGF